MKRIIALLVIVVLVVAGWSGAWIFAAGYIKGQVRALAEADGINSPKVTCGGLAVEGFPFRFDLECTDATISQGDQSLNVAEVAATVLVYRPTHLLVFLKSPAHFEDAFTGTQRDLGWSLFEASVRLSGWSFARASLHVENPRLSDTLVGDVTLATASLFEAHLVDDPEKRDSAKHVQALAAYERLDALEIPGMSVTGGAMSLTGGITGMPDDVRRWGDPGLARTIQQAGGKLTLSSLAYKDARASLDASGEAEIDANGRANGRATIASRGLVDRFGTFVEEPVRTAIFGTPGADGAYTQTLDIRAGVVFAGLVPVAVIPPLF